MSYEVIFLVSFVVVIYLFHFMTNKPEDKVTKKVKKVKVNDNKNYEEFIVDVLTEMKNERISLSQLGLNTEHETVTWHYYNDLFISPDMIVNYDELVEYIESSKYNFGRWSKYIDKEHPFYKNAKMNYYVIDLPFKRKSREQKIIELTRLIIEMEEEKGYVFENLTNDKVDNDIFHVHFKHSYDKSYHRISGNIKD